MDKNAQLITLMREKVQETSKSTVSLKSKIKVDEIVILKMQEGVRELQEFLDNYNSDKRETPMSIGLASVDANAID